MSRSAPASMSPGVPARHIVQQREGGPIPRQRARGIAKIGLPSIPLHIPQRAVCLCQIQFSARIALG